MYESQYRRFTQLSDMKETQSYNRPMKIDICFIIRNSDSDDTR